jgi:signal transduction histidine kinase
MPENEPIQRLLDLSRNLSLSLDLEPFLQQVLSAASELTSSEVASVLEVEESGGQFRFLAVPWFHREPLKAVRVPVKGSLAGWVYQNVKPALVADVPADGRHFKGADQAAEFVTRSLAAVPIVYKGETLGVLEAVNKIGNAHYTEDDLTILETLASQAAVALQNARLMDRVQKSLNEMAQLDKMKADFIAIASHELRTPLGLILGHSTFLREIVTEEHKSQLDIIVRNAMRLKEIVDNMANIDNVQRGMASLRRRSVSIRLVIEEVLDSFHEEAREKRVALRKEIKPDDILIEGDASKIAIALSNLVKNAIVFTDSGGHVMVAAEQIPGYVKVSVMDDGVGIPARDLPHIFERFYQVESHLTRRHGGMGLGLSVARVMIEMHGGRIWAESVEGKGSNFTFILPHEPDPVAAPDGAFHKSL